LLAVLGFDFAICKDVAVFHENSASEVTQLAPIPENSAHESAEVIKVSHRRAGTVIIDTEATKVGCACRSVASDTRALMTRINSPLESTADLFKVANMFLQH
jgi:hypothetical protein